VTVLVVGATGQLGRKIVRELVALGAPVRATYRDSAKKKELEGADLVEADLTDQASLARACRGVDVIVSAVQGLRDVIVDGQTQLLRAAEGEGVARMIPSDYSVDFFKTDDGGNRNLDLRREFNRALDASKVRGTSVLCGAFMDLLAYGAMGPDKNGVYRVFGDFDQKCDFTSTDDVAKYIAAVALDGEAPRVVRVAGDTKSPRELAAIFEELRGTPVKLESAGSLEVLDKMIEKLRAENPAETDPFPIWQRMQYARDMQSGRGKLSPIDNARYPAVHPLDVRTYLSRSFAAARARE
jgi:uncharacterized protein YbjT (DUF2867 family)